MQTDKRMDRRTDMMKLIFAFSNLVKALKKHWDMLNMRLQAIIRGHLSTLDNLDQ